MSKPSTNRPDKAFTLTLLGGAGLMGAGIVQDLVSTRAICRFAEIRVCDSSAERLDTLSRRIADPRITTRVLDVSDRAAVRQLVQDASLCINAVPTLLGFQMSIFETCLEARCDYIDLGGLGTVTVEQLRWHDRFEDAGVTAVIGCGSDPGMSNMLCRSVADELDTIERIKLYWAATLVGDENPILVPPYSISTVLAEYARPSTQFLDGQHTTCRPMSGREYIDLPKPFGRREFMYSPHSEPLTVPLADGFADKGIREFTWKLSLPAREHEAWVGLVKAGFGEFEQAVDVDGHAVDPLRFLEALITRHMAARQADIPEQAGHELHFAIGEGTRDGKPLQVRHEVALGPDPMYDDYADAGTSMNASIAAQLVLTSPTRAGVRAPETYFDPVPYFDEVMRRGMEFRRASTCRENSDT